MSATYGWKVEHPSENTISYGLARLIADTIYNCPTTDLDGMTFTDAAWLRGVIAATSDPETKESATALLDALSEHERVILTIGY